MKARRNPLLLSCPFLVVAVLIWPSLFSNRSFITVEQASSVTHQASHQNINSCLPLYGLIRRHLTTSEIEEYAPKHLFIVAAYDFGNYSVVTMKTKGIRRLYCHYLDKNWHPLGDPVETIVFPNFVAHCCKRHGARYMSVSTETKVSLAQFVPVFDRTKDEPEFGVSVCLSPIFGERISWLLLTELIEHYKLYGVQHFYLYVQSIDEYSEKVLRSYVKSGEAEAVYIGDENDEPTSQYQVAGIQDCLHRSRHQSRYILFADLDERVVTFGSDTLYDYAVKVMGRNATRGALCFNSRAILRTSPLPEKYNGRETLIEHLPSLVYHNSSANPVSCLTCKCMVDPKMVFHMHIHSVKIFFSSDFGHLEVPASEGVIR